MHGTMNIKFFALVVSVFVLMGDINVQNAHEHWETSMYSGERMTICACSSGTKHISNAVNIFQN